MRSSVISIGEMTVVSVAAGWLVAGRVLRPLRVMTATTRRISAGNLHERLAFHGPGDELKDLADTIDALLGRLDGAFASGSGGSRPAACAMQDERNMTRLVTHDVGAAQ